MMVQVDIGGVDVTFVNPGVAGPAPSYPYLLAVERVQEATNDAAASTSFTLSIPAKRLIGLNLLRPVAMLDDNGEVLMEGLIGKILYGVDITITVEA